jgi:SEC-C motif-containing protein
MTFILELANIEQVVLLADRRLSNNGKLVDDESNKAAVMVCRDARLAVAFTGIARARTFDTHRWILEALVECAKPEYLIEPTISRFRERATLDIDRIAEDYDTWAQKTGQSKLDKRLAIVLAGYTYENDQPRIYSRLVSNFGGFGEARAEADDEFTIHLASVGNTPMVVEAAGATAGFSLKQRDALQTLVRENRPAQAMVGKGVEILRAVADSANSKNYVGKQCTSIVLPSSRELSAVAEYHSAKNSMRRFSPSLIEARGGEFGAFLIGSPVLERLDSAGRPLTVAVPKVGRNQPCPCGSGGKYKRCHGRPSDQTVVFGSHLRQNN